MRTSATYPTDAQLKYARDLLDKKDLLKDPKFFDAVNAMDADELHAYVEHIKDSLSSLSRHRVSQIIDSLRSLPNKQEISGTNRSSAWYPAALTTDDGETHRFMTNGQKRVPRGSYAVPTSMLHGDRTNEHNFYSVWIKPDAPVHLDDVPWTVRQYLSDERVKIPRAEQRAVLEIIGEDPALFAEMYGHLIGKCGICGRKLTNDESRARGIGPICAARWGW